MPCSLDLILATSLVHFSVAGTIPRPQAQHLCVFKYFHSLWDLQPFCNHLPMWSYGSSQSLQSLPNTWHPNATTCSLFSYFYHVINSVSSSCCWRERVPFTLCHFFLLSRENKVCILHYQIWSGIKFILFLFQEVRWTMLHSLGWCNIDIINWVK